MRRRCYRPSADRRIARNLKRQNTTLLGTIARQDREHRAQRERIAELEQGAALILHNYGGSFEVDLRAVEMFDYRPRLYGPLRNPENPHRVIWKAELATGWRDKN